MENNNYKLISKFGVTCFYIQKENIEEIQDIMTVTSTTVPNYDLVIAFS